MKLVTALKIAFFMALLSETTFELMSKYDSWIIGIFLGAMFGLFVVSTVKSSRNR